MPSYSIEGLSFTQFGDTLSWGAQAPHHRHRQSSGSTVGSTFLYAFAAAEARRAVVTFRDDGSDQTDVSITEEAQGVLSRGVLEPGAAWKATADTFFLRIKDTSSVRS